MFNRDRYRRIPVKRNPSGYHLIHRNTKRIDITLRIAVTATYLFRRTVMYRSHHIGTDRVRRCCSCDTEIRQFYFTVHGNDDVLRFYISVYNVALMCGFQSQRNLDRNTGCFPYGKFSFSCNIVFQGNALYQLHNDIVNAVILPNVIDIYHIRMRQTCCGLCFLSEFGNKAFVLAEFRFHYLHRYKTIQLMIFCFVDICHTAAADSADDLVSFSYNHSLF